MKKIALVLSGCGHQDGAEITEAASSIIALSQLGADITYFAPDLEFDEVDHQMRKPTGQKRNVLIESGRISRGRTKDLKELKAKDFDGVVFPGGIGAARNLSNFSINGSKGTLHPEVKRVITEFHSHSKPIAAICIAPTLVALALGSKNVSITIGQDKETAQEIEKTGAIHVECSVEDYVTDRENKVVTTPAYMFGNAKPHQVFIGIQNCLKEFFEMA